MSTYDEYISRKLVDGEITKDLAGHLNPAEFSKRIERLYENAPKNFTIEYKKLYSYNTNDLFNIKKDFYTDTLVKNKYAGMYDDVKKLILDIAELERQKAESKLVPRKGIEVRWGSASGDEGVLWGIEFDNRGPNVLRASISPAYSYDDSLKCLRINGVRKMRKTDRSLSELVIERLFVVDNHGKETTMYSV